MDLSVGVDCYDDPIENAEKRDEARGEAQIKTGQEILPLDGKEQWDEGNPGKNFQIEFGKDDAQEQTGEASQKKFLRFYRFHDI
jgi:hypothetical protein